MHTFNVSPESLVGNRKRSCWLTEIYTEDADAWHATSSGPESHGVPATGRQQHRAFEQPTAIPDLILIWNSEGEIKTIVTRGQLASGMRRRSPRDWATSRCRCSFPSSARIESASFSKSRPQRAPTNATTRRAIALCDQWLFRFSAGRAANCSQSASIRSGGKR
jgi:hypothetical protein